MPAETYYPTLRRQRRVELEGEIHTSHLAHLVSSDAPLVDQAVELATQLRLLRS